MENKKSRTKYTLINIATSFGGRILKTVLTFVVRTIFINILGKSYLGVNGVFTSVLNMLSLAELGFSATIVFHLYRPLAQRDDCKVRVLLKFYKSAYRIIGLVIFLLGLCLMSLLPVIIQDYEKLELLGINACLIFIIYLMQSASSYVFFAYRQTVIEADQKKYIIDFVDCFRTVVESGLQIFSLVVLRSFLAYTISTLISTILFNFAVGIIAQYIYPQFFIKEHCKLAMKEIKALFKDCGAMFLYKIESIVLKATDNVVLSAFLGIEIVGVYSSYLMIINACRGFLEKFYISVKHSMGNLYATENIEKKFQYFEIMNFLTFILYGTISVGMIFCCNDLINVWIGNDYVIPQPFSLLIGIEVLLDGLIRNLTQIRNISGAFRQFWYRPIVAIVVNIVSSIILINYLGINGVILGTIFAQMFVGMVVDPYVVMNVCFSKYKPLRHYYKKNIVYLFVLICCGIINLYCCKCILPKPTYLSVCIHAIIVVITVPVIFVMVFRKTAECQHLINLGTKISGKV